MTLTRLSTHARMLVTSCKSDEGRMYEYSTASALASTGPLALALAEMYDARAADKEESVAAAEIARSIRLDKAASNGAVTR